MYKKIIAKLSKLNKNQILIGLAVLAIAVTGVLISNKLFPNNVLSLLRFNSGVSSEVIAKKSIDYLNKSILQNGQTAVLENVSEESGLVKIKIKIGDNTYNSYVTRDGKLLFPEGLSMEAKPANIVATENQDTTDQAPAPEVPNVTPDSVAKVAKSGLDVYVVSRCPFGLQAQRAIAKAVEKIPDLAKQIKVRYIGSIAGNAITAMHGVDEANENFRQICIREEQKDKYWPYVACQMKSSDVADGCLSTAGVDINKLNSCISDPARGLAYAKEDFDLGAKNNIQGSPTFVLNGQQISETNFGGRSADGMKKIICSSSATQPGFCSENLDTEQAAYSFSTTYAQSN